MHRITGDTGKEIKKFVHKLLKEQLVDYIGTDAHRCEGSRTPMMKECSRMLYKNMMRGMLTVYYMAMHLIDC